LSPPPPWPSPPSSPPWRAPLDRVTGRPDEPPDPAPWDPLVRVLTGALAGAEEEPWDPLVRVLTGALELGTYPALPARAPLARVAAGLEPPPDVATLREL
jgi:hypothetical protein